jgi:hypothetical protein
MLREMGIKIDKKLPNSIGMPLKRAEPFIKLNGRIQKRMMDY